MRPIVATLLALVLGTGIGVAADWESGRCCPTGWNCVSESACNAGEASAPVVVIQRGPVRRRGPRAADAAPCAKKPKGNPHASAGR
jgi:hypothetical protein